MRPRLRKWIKRSVLGLLALILAAVGFVAVALQTDWGQRQVRDQVEKALAGVFAGDVSIERMEVGFSGSVVVEGLRITYPNKESAIEVARLSIDCNILPLLGARVRCDTLRVVEPRFWHRPDAGDLLRPNDEEPSADVKIDGISIEGGRVEIPGEVISAIVADLPHLTVDGADLALDIKELTGHVASQDRTVTIEGHAKLDDNVVSLSGGGVASGDTVLAVELAKLDINSLELAGSIDGEIAAADAPVKGWRTKILPRLEIKGVPGERLEATGSIALDSGSITVERLVYTDRIDARLSIRDVDPRAIHEAAPTGLITAETVEVDMAPRFTLDTLEGRARVTLGGQLEGEELGTIAIDATAGDQLWAKIHAASSRGEGDIEVTAERHPSAILSIKKATARGEVANVASLIPGLRARSVKVDATAKGPLDRLEIEGSVILVKARYDQMAAERAFASVDLDAFDVRRAAATLSSGDYSARIDMPRYGDVAGVLLTLDGKFKKGGEKVGVTATAAGFPMLESATVKADLAIKKDIIATVRSIDATSEGIRWTGNTGAVRIAGPVITTPTPIAIASPAAALTIGATIKPRHTEIDAGFARLDLARLKSLHGLDIDAIINGSAKITLRGARMTGTVNARSASISIPEVPRFRAEVTATLDDSSVEVTADGAPLEGKGTVALSLAVKRPADIYDPDAWRRTRTGDLLAVSGDVKGVDVRQIERFTGVKIPAQGRASVALRLPHEGRKALGIKVVADGGRYVGIGGLGAVVQASWGDKLEATASLHQTGDKWADLELGLDAPLHAIWQRPRSLFGRPLTGALKLEGFSLRRVERLRLVRARLGGFVTATARVSGTAQKPVVAIDDGRAIQLNLAGVRLRKLSFAGLYRGDRVETRISGTTRQGGTFKISGAYATGRRDLQLELDALGLEVAALRPFAPASDHPLAEIGGKLDLQKVVVNVDPAHLRASGRVRLRNGAVLLEGGARAITNINASLVLRGDKIRLATLTARNGNGTIRASGEARFAGYTPEEVVIDAIAKGIPYVAGSYLASIDVESKITGSYRDGTLMLVAPVRRGRVDLKDTGVELQSIGDLEDVVFVDSHGDPERRRRDLSKQGRDRRAGQTTPELPERGLKTVVRINLDRGIRVVSAEVDAMVVGSMEAAFVGATLVSLTGQLRARGGKVKLFERDYTLVRAIATFDGPLPINPDLDIEINRTFPEATVTAQVTGRLEQVLSASSQSKHIQLTSDANFTEEQILALMLGQSPDDVAQQNTSDKQVGGIGRAIVAGEVRDILRSVGLKVDVVRFHDDGWEFGKWVRLRLGDLFSRRVLLGYRFRDAGEQLENTNEGTLEVPVTRSVNLEGRVGDRGIGSFDLLWIKRF